MHIIIYTIPKHIFFCLSVFVFFGLFSGAAKLFFMRLILKNGGGCGVTDRLLFIPEFTWVRNLWNLIEKETALRTLFA